MTKKIFIVEDDEAIVEVMSIILLDAGFSVTTAANGTTLKKNLQKELPDLIIMDIWIGEENGAKLTKQLKANTRTKRIPIIMISANNETKKIAEEAGADDFLAKPFDITQLAAAVEKHI